MFPVVETLFSVFWKILQFALEFLMHWLFLEVVLRLKEFFQHAGSTDIITSLEISRDRLRFDLIKLTKLSRSVFMNIVLLFIVLSFIAWIVEYCIEEYPTVLCFIRILLVCPMCYFRTEGLQMGAALAWCYYFTYLKIMLPKFTESPNVWMDEKGVERDIDGWFILIPSDSITPDAIKDDRIQMKGNSEPIKANLAATLNRVFKYTVYKVEKRYNKGSFYCYIEYTTPVGHFNTMAQSEYTEQTNFGSAEMSYQNYFFERSIRKILDDNEAEVLRDNNRTLKDFVQFIRVKKDEKNIADSICDRRDYMRRHSDKGKEVNQPTTKPVQETKTE